MNTESSPPVFLTGSTGLLGGHFLVRLFQSGKKIRALIRKTSTFEQLELICSFYGTSFEALKEGVEWVYGDTLDYVGLCEWMYGVSDVYHCAAVVSFDGRSREALMRTNIQGTSNVVDAALQNGVKRLCYISSIAALGSAQLGQPIHEDSPRKGDKKYSGYSESKFKAELEVWRGQSQGLNVVIVNPGVIIGPGNPSKGSLLIVENGRKGMLFYTKATTGYVDVRDVCRAATELMEKELFNQRFILVSENAHNGVLFGLVASEYGKRPPRIEAGRVLLRIAAFLSETWGILTHTTPMLSKDTVRSAQRPEVYSNARIREALDFTFIPLKETIHTTCDFLKQHRL